MDRTVIVDTDVFSFPLKGHSFALLYEEILRNKKRMLSFMSVRELAFWAINSNWGLPRISRLYETINQFKIVYPDRTTCEICARLKYECRHQMIAESDLWIAATAIAEDCPLVTHNAKHFARIPGLKLITGSMES